MALLKTAPVYWFVRTALSAKPSNVSGAFWANDADTLAAANKFGTIPPHNSARTSLPVQTTYHATRTRLAR
jgi:hypothetical protein